MFELHANAHAAGLEPTFVPVSVWQRRSEPQRPAPDAEPESGPPQPQPQPAATNAVAFVTQSRKWS